jgi:hypothetical protein
MPPMLSLHIVDTNLVDKAMPSRVATLIRRLASSGLPSYPANYKRAPDHLNLSIFIAGVRASKNSNTKVGTLVPF